MVKKFVYFIETNFSIKLGLVSPKYYFNILLTINNYFELYGAQRDIRLFKPEFKQLLNSNNRFY